MERNILRVSTIIAIVLTVLSNNVIAQSDIAISKDDAYKILQEKIIDGQEGKVNIYVSKDVVKADTQIKTLFQSEVSPNFDSWFFFIDDFPFASWSHPCRYVYVNAKDGSVTVLNKNQPPKLSFMETLVEQTIETTGKLFDFSNYRSSGKNICSSANEYAIIINGGGDVDNNWERYWNHISAMYSALVDVYGYSDDHIYVLNSDGTNPANDRHMNDGTYMSSPLDLDGDGDTDIQFAATKANVTSVFNTLQGILTSNDNLFIYTTDHGGQESGLNVYLNLWGDVIRDDEFATEVNKINAGKVNICMVQCHSGGFIDDLQATNRVITTSCDYDESAYPMPPDYLYSEFTYYWISAIAGETPEGTAVDADFNDDGFVSMSEAFIYAQSHDTRSETPQYNSTPLSLGTYLALNGQIPYISGPSNLCSSGATYSVVNAPPGVYVRWEYSNNIESYYGGNTWIALRATGNGEGWVEAHVPVPGCDTLHLPRMTVWAGIPTMYSFYTEVNGEEVKYYEVAQVCPSTINCFDAEPEVEEMDVIAEDYTWHLPPGFTIWGLNGNGLCFDAHGTIGSPITGDVTNACGTGYGEIKSTLPITAVEGFTGMPFRPTP
ncbi:MAG: C13 family peptidase [Prolixibacteraceae bacterium]|nr:C13 family peptidase [Prolixibacteraceae bacterium]